MAIPDYSGSGLLSFLALRIFVNFRELTGNYFYEIRQSFPGLCNLYGCGGIGDVLPLPGFGKGGFRVWLQTITKERI